MRLNEDQIQKALEFIKSQFNGEIPYKYGSREAAQLMVKYAEVIWDKACEAQMNEVYKGIAPDGNTNYHAIKHWTKRPNFE